MPWEDFKSRVLAFLDSAADEVQLVYKFVGDNSRATQLNDAEAFSIAMDHLCHKAFNARTRVVALEVKNAAVKQTTTTKAKKRTRADDIPPASSDEDVTQLKAYKQLESQIRCELHHGHCFVDRTSGYDNHRRLDHAEMTLWAKKIVSLASMREREKLNWVRLSVMQQSTTHLTASILTAAQPKSLVTRGRHHHLKSMLPYRI
ncbi:hypothetical protein EDB19DRAFT_1631718 [Suillus lakei]|nr:hypothetical protein EDB19DRAFT_1631718 [Suillus lakei]